MQAEELKKGGQEPYAYTFQRTHNALELQELFKELPNGEESLDMTVSMAGRIMARRVMGKLAFCRLVDSSGEIQVSCASRIRHLSRNLI